MPAPFAAAPPLKAGTEDAEVFGTVTAPLTAETIPIGSSMQNGAAFQFGLEAQPLVALLTFEVASPQIEVPPEIYVNGQDIGPASLVLPDLADPGLSRAFSFAPADDAIPIHRLGAGAEDRARLDLEGGNE